MKLASFVVLSLVAACGQSGPSGFGLAVTATFSAEVNDDALLSVTQLEITSTGDETFTHTAPLERSAERVERFVYRPEPSTFSIDLHVAGLDSNGNVVAEGSTNTLTLTPDRIIYESVTLVPPGQADLGMPDLTPPTLDGGKLPDGQVASTIQFRSVTSIATAAGPVDVLARDLNGDSIPDVVVAAHDGGKVQVFFGQKGGTLPATPSFESTIVAQPVAIAFVGTAAVSFGVVDQSDGSFVPFTVNGSQVTAGTRSSLFAGADSVATGDFDHDGLTDVVFASSTVANVLVAYGAAISKSYTPSGLVTRVHSADVDKDGYLDIVLAENKGVEVLRNAGSSRSFAALPIFATNVAIIEVAVFDLDHDGDNDILALHDWDNVGHGTVFLNNGGGTFAAPTDAEYAPGQNAHHALVADFDNDGELDIATADSLYGESLGIGLASLASPPNYSRVYDLYAFESGVGAFDAADFNGDKLLDVVAVNTTTSTISLARGVTTPTKYALDAATADFPGTGGATEHFYDWDGDGIIDVAQCDNNGIVDLWTGYDTGRFTHDYYDVFHGVFITSIAFAKLDKDAYPDAVFVTNDGRVGVAFGQGKGTFSKPAFQQVGTAFIDVSLIDVDRNGTLDVVALDNSTMANANGANVVVVTNTGNGVLGGKSVYAATNPLAFAIGDVNADGHTDVVVLSTSGSLSTLLDTAGGLAPGVGTTALTVAHATGFALLHTNDGDEYLDVAVNGDTVQLAHGTMDGSFATPSTLYAMSSTGITSGDVDGDGHDDLVLATDHSIFVFPQATQPASQEFAAGAGIQQLTGGIVTPNGLLSVMALGYSGVFLINVSK